MNLVLKHFKLLFISLCVVLSFNFSGKVRASQLGEQIATDLLATGVSVAAALSGNTAVALSAGIFTNYLSTYGIKGAKSLAKLYKGKPPRDLGEINLYYVYLINSKRNLYLSLNTMARALKDSGRDQNFNNSINDLISSLLGACEKDCVLQDFDESFVNFQFVDMALDARATLDVNNILSVYELKNTFQYMMLLYMDIMYFEQMLIEGMQDVMAKRILDIRDELEKNVYLSKEEKDYLMAIGINIAARFQGLRDKRKVALYLGLKNKVDSLIVENDDLDDQIDDYQSRNFEKSLFGSTDSEKFAAQLQDLIKDVDKFGTSIDPFSTNPLQTGSSLQNYFLSEKILLLEKDTLFQMRANKLETTEDVADYAHRLKVMRSHGNNILRQVMKVMNDYASGKHMSVGEWLKKDELDKLYEELINECRENANCVVEELKKNQLNLKSALVDNLELASIIFKDLPFMHSIEAMNTYQLVNLIQLEVLHGQIKLSSVEFEIFNEKQEKLIEAIEKNNFLSDFERVSQLNMIENSLKKWKLKILKRKFDYASQFIDSKKKFSVQTLELVKSWEQTKELHAEALKGIECKTTIFNKDRQRCKARKEYYAYFDTFINSEQYFQKSQIPEEFFNKRGENEKH